MSQIDNTTKALPAVSRECEALARVAGNIHSELGDLITALRPVLTPDQFRRLREPYEPQPVDDDCKEAVQELRTRTPLSDELEMRVRILSEVADALLILRQQVQV